MATTRKLKSGQHQGIYYQYIDGKRVVKYTGAVYYKKDALADAIDAQAKVNRKAAAAKGALSARTSWGDWWDVFVTNRTLHSDRRRIEDGHVRVHIRPQWGDRALNAIPHKDVQDWVDKLIAEQYAINTVHDIFGIFRMSINAAVTKEVLDASPCAKIKLPRRPKVPKAHIDQDAKKKLLKKMKQPYRDLQEFIGETGCRPGEATGMHAGADQPSGLILIRDVYLPGLNKIRPWPKDIDVREVPRTERAKRIIARNLAGRDQQAGCGIEHIHVGKNKPKECRQPLIFVDEAGRPISPADLHAEVERAVKLAGLPEDITPYAGRRGYSTQLAHGGADVFTVMALMGHSKPEESAGYVQLTTQAIETARSALGDPRPKLRAVKTPPAKTKTKRRRETPCETDSGIKAPQDAPKRRTQSGA